MSELIDISKLDKAEVLVALFNASKQQGLGFLDPTGRDALTKTKATELLKQSQDFDYLHGRVMKVDLSGDRINPWLYDRDNGAGAASRALEPLMKGAA